MAVQFDLKTLGDSYIEIVKKSLVLTPILKPAFRGRGKLPPSKPSIAVFSTDGATIRLPFTFVRKVFQCQPNLNQPHLPIIRNGYPAFKVKLREEQIVPTQEAYQQLQQHSTTLLALYPGFGKTIIGMFLWHTLTLAGVILCHREVIGDAWEKTIQTCLPDLLPSLWYVGKNDPPPPGSMPSIIICLDGRVGKIPENYLPYIGTMIIDECHLFCAPGKVEALLRFSPRYIIGESATPERPDKMESIIYSLIGMHRVERISRNPYYFYSVETNVEVPEVRDQNGLRFEKLCQAYAHSEYRNGLIVDIIKTNLHRKYIVLTRVADHVEILRVLLEKEGISVSTLYAKQKTYSDARVLIGTISKIGVGFDEANVCSDFKGQKADCVFLVHSIKEKAPFEQARGRVMRVTVPAPVVIWLHDKNGTPRNHLKGLLPWIDHTNGTLVQTTYYPGRVILPSK